jgi:hypothetical protein
MDAMHLNLSPRRAALGLLLLFAALAACDRPHPEVPRITVAEAFALHRSSAAVFVDVRTGRTWETSGRKIAGALRRDPDAAAEWGAAFDGRAPLVLYCT